MITEIFTQDEQDWLVENAERVRALREHEHKPVRAGDLLPGGGTWPGGLVAVPILQMEDIYGRFNRLTRLGQATFEQWAEMPDQVAELRRAVFAEAEFGAVFAGNWVDRRGG